MEDEEKTGSKDLAFTKISTRHLGFHWICQFLLVFHPRLQQDSRITHLNNKRQLDHPRYQILKCLRVANDEIVGCGELIKKLAKSKNIGCIRKPNSKTPPVKILASGI